MDDHVLSSFRTERYGLLNKCRWDHFLSMGIPLEGKTVFEPGAGIGDQTEWLLTQGVQSIIVNEGRGENLDVIHERFDSDPRVMILPGDLEQCLSSTEFGFKVDLVFCYGVYYHIREMIPDWSVMRGLSRIGQMIALDYLVGDDNEIRYDYENNSVSLSHMAFRPKTETLISALKDIWGYCYVPPPLNWVDPQNTEDRQVIVASHLSLDNPNLILQ